PPPTDSHPLSLHDALPISYFSQQRGIGVVQSRHAFGSAQIVSPCEPFQSFKSSGHESDTAAVLRGNSWSRDSDALRMAELPGRLDRKSTRLTSSHQIISYA